MLEARILVAVATSKPALPYFGGASGQAGLLKTTSWGIRNGPQGLRHMRQNLPLRYTPSF